MEGPFIRSLDNFRGAGKGGIDVAVGFDLFVALHRFAGTDVVVNVLLLGEGRLDVRPGDFQLARGADGVPLLRRDETEEILLPDDFHAGNVFHR